MEAKKNGDLRPCGDYGAFNQILVGNRLLIQDFYLQLHCKRLYLPYGSCLSIPSDGRHCEGGCDQAFLSLQPS